MRLRVVCGFGETMETFLPTSVFTSVDLPAFGRPTMATNPDLNGMQNQVYAVKPPPSTRESNARRPRSGGHFVGREVVLRRNAERIGNAIEKCKHRGNVDRFSDL